MLSLFISFDIMNSSLNQFFFMFFMMFFLSFNSLDFFFFKNTLVTPFLKIFFKEFMLTTKLKFLMNLMIFLSIFFFFLLTNLLGLIPFHFTLSTQLNFCFFFSLVFWFSIMMNNFFNNYNFFVPHLVPFGSPVILSQFMVLIETISQFIRPLTLSVRLMANMTAGHLIMILCSSPILIMGLFSIPLSILFLLELMVAFIQSYVFLILLSMYLSDFND